MLPDPSTITYITIDELKQYNGPIIDVRIEEAFEEGHLPNALNICVYETSFTDKVLDAFPIKDTSIVVYGQGDPYKAGMVAIGRLQAMGYAKTMLFEGGFSLWQKQALPIKASVGTTSSPLKSGRMALDSENTRIRWIGRNLLNQHDGEARAKQGFLEIDDEGQPVGGEVTVDMNLLTCRDIEDSNLAKALIDHLVSVDFFDVSNHPESSMRLEVAKAKAGATYGHPNWDVSGVLTVRGKELPVAIEAMIERSEGGYRFQSVFNFDRTKTGAIYGSGKFFERLGMHMVNDMVTIDINASFKLEA